MSEESQHLSKTERIRRLEQQVAELNERLEQMEAAARAFAVVYAIPRVTPGGDGDTG